MLSMADTDLNMFLPTFAKTGVPVAFLVPTPTGYEKSIMDATTPVRTLLLNEKIHNYTIQPQGPEAKVMIESYFVYKEHVELSYASLYRPKTKDGDPRIWFSGLRKYCNPRNLLALFIVNKHIYVVNLSDPANAESMLKGGFVYSILQAAADEKNSIAMELLKKIKEIHNHGWLPSITPGDPGVGDTLENALGISRNNSQQPDYKGIELKSARLTRGGKKKQTTRQTLFAKVPDEGLTYRQIVEKYGKWQIPRGKTESRLQLYETLRASRPNAYGLLVAIEANDEKLDLLYQSEIKTNKFISAWIMEKLQEQLLTKHHETFWVKANAIRENDREFFRYDYILHTKNPNASLLGPLIDCDKITIDLAAHISKDGKWRDHGILFKMEPDDLPLLFGEPAEYDLTGDISSYLGIKNMEAIDHARIAETDEITPIDYTEVKFEPETPTL